MPDIEINGARIHVVEAGAGPAIVFAHGWGASLRFWESAIARLSGAYRCVAFDWKGFGDSDKPDAAYRMEDFAAELHELVAKLGLGRFVLVGHSMGGMISALFALRWPELLQGLVLCNAPVRGPTCKGFLIRTLLLPVLRWFLFLFSKIAWVRRRSSRLFYHRHSLPEGVLEDFVKGTYHSQMAAQASISATDLSARLAEIRTPTLVISSDRDRIIRADQYALAGERIPGARSVVFHDVGHCPMLEEPEAFNDALAEFVASLQPAEKPAV